MLSYNPIDAHSYSAHIMIVQCRPLDMGYSAMLGPVPLERATHCGIARKRAVRTTLEHLALTLEHLALTLEHLALTLGRTHARCFDQQDTCQMPCMHLHHVP